MPNRHSSLHRLRQRRRALMDPSSRLRRTHRFTVASTNVDTDDVFGSTASRSQPVSFAFRLLRTGAAAGLIFEFGSATRGVAAYVDGADLVVAAGAGTGSADDGVTLSITDAVPLASAATATLTLASNPVDGATIIIGAKTYTIQATLTNVDGNVKRGASASDTLDNLIAAINLGAGSGTTYAAAMTTHPEVSAAAGAGDTVAITALIAGDAANSVALIKPDAGSWGAATLRGGTPAHKFVVSINPGIGKVEVYRSGQLLGFASAVNGNFGGAWADTANGAIGNVQGASNNRVPGGSQIALADAQLIGSVDVYLHQRVYG